MKFIIRPAVYKLFKSYSLKNIYIYDRSRHLHKEMENNGYSKVFLSIINQFNKWQYVLTLL